MLFRGKKSKLRSNRGKNSNPQVICGMQGKGRLIPVFPWKKGKLIKAFSILICTITVKKTTKDRLYQFQKRLDDGGIIQLGLGDYQVKIEPEDTAKMFYGNYKFDIQLQYEDQLKETFVGDFVLTDEVTFNENER